MILRHITKLHGKIFWLLLWAGVMPLTGSMLISGLLYNYPGWVSAPGPGKILTVYLVSTITMGLALTPTTFVAVAGGYWLGWYSLPCMILAYTGASGLGYLLTRQLDGHNLHSQLAGIPGVQPYLSGIARAPFGLVFWSRLSPALPFAIMNLLLSSLRIPLRTFLLGGIPGMLPRTLLACWLGIGLSDLYSWWEGNAGDEALIKNGVTIALLLISIAGLALYFKNSKQQVLKETN